MARPVWFRDITWLRGLDLNQRPLGYERKSTLHYGPKRTNRNQQRERLTSNEVVPCWFVSVGLLHRDFIAGSESPRGSLRFTAAGRSSIYVAYPFRSPSST